MGAGVKKERRKNPGTDIAYGFQDGGVRLDTVCPFGKVTPEAKHSIRVGSAYCHECENFGQDNRIIRVVHCRLTIPKER